MKLSRHVGPIPLLVAAALVSGAACKSGNPKAADATLIPVPPLTTPSAVERSDAPVARDEFDDIPGLGRSQEASGRDDAIAY